MSIFSWFGKKKVVEPPLAAKPKPFFMLTLEPTGHLTSYSYLPAQDTNEDALRLTKNFATAIFLLHSGQLMPIIQHGISVGGVVNNTQGLSQMALSQLNLLLSNGKQNQEGEALDRLCVSPTEVFDPRPHGVPLND